MKIQVKHVDIDPDEIIAKRGLAIGGSTQKYLEASVLRYCGKYLPYDNGILEASGRPFPAPGMGYVGWFTPYAHYMYEGEVYGPNIPIFDEAGNAEGYYSPPGQTKYPTGRSFTYSLDKHPQAGSHWVERMLANDSKELTEEVAQYAGGKAK